MNLCHVFNTLFCEKNETNSRKLLYLSKGERKMMKES